MSATACGDDDPIVPTEDAGDVGDVDGVDADDADAEPDDADEDGDVDGPTALLQVIHEAPDPDARVVDVYVNGDLFIDDFEFRSATAFRAVPADAVLSVSVAPADSTSADDSIAELGTVNLAEDEEFAAVVHGVVDPSAVSEVGDGREIALGLELLEDARTEPVGSDDEAVVFHSGPDIPAVDVVLDDAQAVVDDLGYAEFSEYVEFPAGQHTLDVVRAVDQRRYESFQTSDLGGGTSFVLVVSGMLEVEGTERPELAMMAYRPDGQAVALDQAARLQVVQNSADPAVGPVDVYVDDERIAEDLAFRQASSFKTLLSGVDLEVAVVPAGADVSEAAISETTRLGEGGSYLGVASGVADPDEFADNPDGADISLDFIAGNTRERSTVGEEVQLRAFHGVTDAPAIDVVHLENGEQLLVEDLSYGEFSDLLSLDPQNLQLQVRPTGDSSPVATIGLDVNGDAGRGINLVASGFLDPEANPTNGIEDPGFALLAITQEGEVTVLKPAQ
ncbi:MAG: DUF4397 domain-containing protein [Persicimonas sp.]